MTDYAKANLDELDGIEIGPHRGVFTRSALGATQIGLSRFRYAPNSTGTPGHHHRTQEEIYLVVSGSGQMRLEDEVIDLKQWDVVRVAPTVRRAFRSGPDGMELVIAGGNRPPEGDGQVLPDFWPAD